MPPTSVDAYHTQATTLFARYEALAFETVHAVWLHLLPPAPARVLDVGAGSGRDAAWLARRDYRVTAVEPATALRRLGERRHSGLGIDWREDRLPALGLLNAPADHFELILLSAVWMHVTPAQRPSAFTRLAKLLDHGGLLVFTLRHGPAPADRLMHPVAAPELLALAGAWGLTARLVSDPQADVQGRDTVRWQTVCLAKG